MSRHQALLIVWVLVVGPCSVVAVVAMGQPRPTQAPVQAVVQAPPELVQRLDALSSQVQALSKPPPPPQPPTPPEPIPSIERVPANGQDLADLLGVSIWKFRFLLHEGRYTAYLWLERWTRDGATPDSRLLASATVGGGADELTLKLPTEADPRLFVRIGELYGENDPAAAPVGIHTPIAWSLLDKRPLDVNRPVPLITLAHNDTGMAITGLENVHRDNDQTIYIKLVFTPGEAVPFDSQRWVTGSSHAPGEQP